MHLVGKVSDHGNYSFHCVAFMICNLLHLGLVLFHLRWVLHIWLTFMTFMVSVTFMVVITLIILWVMQILMKHKM